jgi:hypothetical protein
MGFYDEFEGNRVVFGVLNPDAKQAQLDVAIAPVADRLLKQFKAAQAEFKTASKSNDTKGAKSAKDQMEALDAHNLMSSQALSSEAVRKGLKAILLGPAKLYEMLRDQK